MIVAIDGPSGSGKSSVAHAIARRCNLTYLDTGAMYRSVAWLCLEAGVDVADDEAVANVARTCTIEFEPDGKGQRVLANGTDVTEQIRTPDVERAVSPVSAVPAVREVMVALQRKVGERGDVVAEGRDIGTVVFPAADVKVFLTASPEARAHRRAVQRAGGNVATDAGATADAADEAQILADIRSRDEYDSTRKTSPLRPADDAVRLDSSELGFEEVVQAVIALSPELETRAAAKSESAAKEPEAKDAEPKAEAAKKPAASDNPATEDARKPEAKADATAKKPVAKATKGSPKPVEGKMHAFRGNSFDDYFDHAMEDYPLPSKALMWFAVIVVWCFTKIVYPWKIDEAEKLVDEAPGSVIVMNHQSMLEPCAMITTLWMHGVRVRAVYKSEFDSTKIVTWLFSRVGALPVERGKADMKLMRRAKAALQRGECVLIYPEGTRIRDDKQEIDVHGGYAIIAELAKAQVLPVAIVGCRNLKFRSHAYIKVGDPITWSDLKSKKRKAKIAEMEELGMKRVYELQEELREEHPGLR